MIAIRNLHKRRGGRAVLAGVDADIGEGEAVAIVGASGGGKTTLLRCLDALESFDEGTIRVAGFDLGPGGGHQDGFRDLRSAVGMVFQDLHLFPHLTVLENVTLAPTVARRTTPAAAIARAEDLLRRVGLSDRAGAYPHELSGGQKQRVAVVRALATEPRVLLLDEPTSALDPETATGVVASIRALTRGTVTVVLVTHHRDLAAKLADRILVLEDGKLRPA